MKPETLAKVKQLMLRASEDELREVTEYMNLRWNAIRAEATRVAMNELSEGDRVRIVRIKPKYMVGHTATITRRRQTKFEVKLDHEIIRAGRRTNFLVIPAQCLELI